MLYLYNTILLKGLKVMSKKHREQSNTKKGKNCWKNTSVFINPKENTDINQEVLKKLSEDATRHVLTVPRKVNLLDINFDIQVEQSKKVEADTVKFADTTTAKFSNPDEDNGSNAQGKKKDFVLGKDQEAFLESALGEPEISDEKLAILSFFRLNMHRGITRQEVSDFFNTYFGIKTFRVIKNKLKVLGIEMVLGLVIDLRHRYVPKEKLRYPEKRLLKKVKREVEKQKTTVQNEEKNLPKAETSEMANEVIDEVKSETGEEMVSNEHRINEPVGLKTLFQSKKNVRYYFLADDIFDFRIKTFVELIDNLASLGIQPVFCMFEEDLPKLDAKKEECFAAQHFLKLFAMDDNGDYTCLFHGNRPSGDNFINYCLNNKVTVVTGDPLTILNCKMNSVKVYVPDFFKTRTPNPLKGDNVLGFDSCVALNVKKQDLNDLLKNAKSILLPDIVVGEVNKNVYLLRVCAYYGDVKKAERVSEVQDKNIVNFYKENSVDMVYTLDAGFKVFARFAKVPCIFLKDKLLVQSNIEIYDIIKNHKYSEPEVDISEVNKVFYDSLINYENGKLRMDSDTKAFVFVYRKEFKRTESIKYLDLFTGDKIIITKKNKILITELTDVKLGVGRILFWGTESELYKKYPKFCAEFKSFKGNWGIK